jgi:hypothetical protein
VDASIVRQNVRRAGSGAGLDVAYLATLSPDSVPALVQAYQSPALPSRTREAAGVALVCQANATPNRSQAEWQSFTLSRFWGQAALRPVQASLDKYHLLAEDRMVTVTSPAGDKFDCYGSISGD